MAGDNLERVEVDRLIEGLKKPAPKPAPPQAPAATAISSSAPAPTANPVSPVASQPMYRRPLKPMPLRPVPAVGDLSLIERAQDLAMARLQELQGLVADRGNGVVRTCVGLGVALSISMLFWPYAKGCGFGLFFYLFAVITVIVAGSWGAKLSWEARLGITHTIAVAVLVWGLTLGAHETLMRVGYAKAQATWMCP